MASLLGNLSYVGQATILTTQGALANVSSAANLWSINTGIVTGSIHHVQFRPSFLAQTPTADTVLGFGCLTLGPLLFTRAGAVVVMYNPNTTALPGDLLAEFRHSIVQ